MDDALIVPIAKVDLERRPPRWACVDCLRHLPRSAFTPRNRERLDRGWQAPCRECCNRKQAEIRAAVSRRFNELVGAWKMEQGCAVCGYREHPAALHVDRIVPGDPNKHGGYRTMRDWFAARGRQIGREEVEAELALCQVLCANHHAIKTAEENYSVAHRPAIAEAKRRARKAKAWNGR